MNNKNIIKPSAETLVVGARVKLRNGQTTTVTDAIHDPIAHPSHYTSHPSGIECIQVTQHMNFNLGNVVKYVWRNGLKDSDNNIQDLKKAQWYLSNEIERLEKQQND